MTNRLKWRLCALIGTVALTGGALVLHAQNDVPAPAKTPEEAGARFYQLLSAFDSPRRGAGNVNATGRGLERSLNVISRSQLPAVAFGGFGQSSDGLLSLLSQQRSEPGFDAQIKGTSGNQTIVEVVPSTTPRNREVVVVPEDGGFRVDLKATFGRWNNLSGEPLDIAWLRYTGQMSPALLTSPTFARVRENARRASCQSNMKQQMLGIIQYTQDYDEKMPSARKWIDVLQPYVKSEQIFKCPSLTATTGGEGNGYAFNQSLSQINLSAINEPWRTVSIYETSNPSRNWFGAGTGRAYRHWGGSNIAFADGHIKWFLKGHESGVTFKP